MHPPISLMTRTAKLARVPVGADPQTYRPGIKKERMSYNEMLQARIDKLSPEEKERERQSRKAYESIAAQWQKDFDELGPVRAGELKQQRMDAMAVHPIVADFNARVAVEGDTDLNHDNLEG
ncbi:MAG: hypothetical protein P0Y65_05615 [Candidatus Devosia phytovorans]|uniref:Uncharacterized protein n=1 Tax=Candidatus Devosia phytovorans TaxID=3121372 RepID=A0AAJ5VYE7_9HYPH|nr:hypothetical protein [Devosia sp.]WEK05732.1 MAG: hypothetical protein P0Y65_05615 [Devosia sp.]